MPAPPTSKDAQQLLQPMSNARTNAAGGGGGGRRPVKDPVRYKTQLCVNWKASGKCPYGLKCQFAHGADELRARLDKETKRTAKKEQAPKDSPTSEATCLPVGAPLAAPPGLALASAPSAAREARRLARALNTIPLAPMPPSPPLPPTPPTPPATVLPAAILPSMLAEGFPSPLGSSAQTRYWEPETLTSHSRASCGASSAHPVVIDLSDRHSDLFSERQSERLSGRHSEESDRFDDESPAFDDEALLRCNALTGEIEVAVPPGAGRQMSHTTASVRRQISMLFDEPSEGL